MKVVVNDWDECFSIDLGAENIEDASLLCQFALNSTKEIRAKGVSFDNNHVEGYIVLGKRKQYKGTIG